jgi:hypothetical protein
MYSGPYFRIRNLSYKSYGFAHKEDLDLTQLKWVANLERWLAKLGRWVAKMGRWMGKLGRWVAKLVARLLASVALKNTKWATLATHSSPPKK